MKFFEAIYAAAIDIEERNKNKEAFFDKYDFQKENIAGITINKDEGKGYTYSIIYKCGTTIRFKKEKDRLVPININTLITPHLSIDYKQIEYFKDNYDVVSIDEGGGEAYRLVLYLNTPRETQITWCEEKIEKLDSEFAEEKFLVDLYERSKENEFIRIVNMFSYTENILGKEQRICKSLGKKDRSLIYNLIKHGNDYGKWERNVDDTQLVGILKTYCESVCESTFHKTGLKNIVSMYNNFELPKDLNKRYKDIKNKKREIYRDFLAKNYLKLENFESFTDGEIKKMYEKEKAEKIFSSSARTDVETNRTLITAEKYASADRNGDTWLKRYHGDKNEISLYKNRLERETFPERGSVDTQKPIGETNDEKTLEHELGHFEQNQIVDNAVRMVFDGKENEEETRALYFVFAEKQKRYIKDKAQELCKNAYKSLGIKKNIGRGRVYTSYDSKNDNIEAILVGNSINAKYSPPEFIAETRAGTNFNNKALQDLYNKCFEGDFSKLTPEKAMSVFKEVGFNDEKDIKEAVDLYLARKDFLSKMTSDHSYPFVEGLELNNGEIDEKILEDSKDNKEFFGKIAVYQIYLSSLKEICEGRERIDVDSRIADGILSDLREKVKSKYDKYDWSKLNTENSKLSCNKDELKKYTKNTLEKYLKRLESIDKTEAVLRIRRIKYYKFYAKELKIRHVLGTMIGDFNLDNDKEVFERIGSSLPKENEYLLLSKFADIKPCFNKLIYELENASSEDIKDILRDNLKDEFSAWVFFRMIGKNLEGYESPFKDIEKKIKEERGLLSDSQERLNKIIDEIKISRKDIKKCVDLKNKNFSEIFEKYKKIEELNVNRFDAKNDLESSMRSDEKRGKLSGANVLRSRKRIEIQVLNDEGGLQQSEVNALNKSNNNNQQKQNNQEPNFSYYDIMNMLRMKVLLDVAMNRLDKPNVNLKDVKIMIPTGPLHVIWKGQDIGFPNVIMNVNGRAYYVSNEWSLWHGKRTSWRELKGVSFENLSKLEKESRNDGRRNERVKDKHKVESISGVGAITLIGEEQIKAFGEKLDDAIKRMKELYRLTGSMYVAKSKKREMEEALEQTMKGFEESEKHWMTVAPANVLNELHKGIDYKFKNGNEDQAWIKRDLLNNMLSLNDNEALLLRDNRERINKEELGNGGRAINKRMGSFKPVLLRDENAYNPTCCK